MGILSLSSNKVSMTFGDEIPISLYGHSYLGVTFILRLLTYEELLKVGALPTLSPGAAIELEDEVFSLVVDEALGLGPDIDLDNLEAGIVSSVAGAVLGASQFYFRDVKAGIEKGSGEYSVFDQMQLVVANNFNIPHQEVVAMPIDELARKFALFQATFPSQALEFNDPNNPTQ